MENQSQDGAHPQTEALCVPNEMPDTFARDVRDGLTASPRYLSSKYFYDAKGDKLFQQIMDSPEYYLTGCEKEVLQFQSDDIASLLRSYLPEFDLIELGAGDCAKTIYLLQSLLNQEANFTFFPVDISPYTISDLEIRLPGELPGLQVRGICGEFFDALDKANATSARPKVVLFLGSTIGNMNPDESLDFLRQLNARLRKDDLLLTGFDLQKNPKIILDAYNDPAGVTRAFNLNLLERINRELDADFDLTKFDHYEQYDVESGACKSFLISLEEQEVTIGRLDASFAFAANEYIFTEISQKYTPAQIASFARQSGYRPVAEFCDSRKWFMDALWQVM